MSDSQKIKLEMSAYSKTRVDYERHALRLISLTDCPFVSVFASSGGPSTESSFTCEFEAADVSYLAGWSPDCNSRFPGKVDYCPLVRYMARRWLAARNEGNAEAMADIRDRLFADPSRDLIVRAIAWRGRAGWKTDLDHVGLYFFLEAAELVESLRAKGDPVKEAADCLLVFLSLLGYQGVDVGAVLVELERQLDNE